MKRKKIKDGCENQETHPAADMLSSVTELPLFGIYRLQQRRSGFL